MKRLIVLLTALATALALAMPAVGASHTGAETQEYIVLMNGNGVSNKQLKAIEEAGGTVLRSLPQIGLAVVSGDSAFAASAGGIKGVQSLSYNAVVKWLPDNEPEIALETGNPPTSGDDDFFFDLQWGHDAVNAPEAWYDGRRGAGATVAVLDGGFDLDHPDLAPNINFALSMDFTGEGLQYTLTDPFSHGSHTAGTVAAADNGFGTIGVAPEAELILVKVLGDAGSGSFADVISGIVYAADVDADIINMSLGARLERRGFLDEGDPEDPNDDVFVTAREVAGLLTAIDRATTYAHQRGTLVIASAGNDGEDYDHAGPVVHSPSDSPNVLSISALGPQGWAIDPGTDLDLPAVIGVSGDPTYTNYGQSVIDFGAPGGSIYFDLPGLCTVAGLTRPCFVFDLVFSTGNNSWYWSAGTSMAAPHAAGVAALIVGANGGDMKPSAVERELRRLADDLGKPGNDDFYGLGRVNAIH